MKVCRQQIRKSDAKKAGIINGTRGSTAIWAADQCCWLGSDDPARRMPQSPQSEPNSHRPWSSHSPSFAKLQRFVQVSASSTAASDADATRALPSLIILYVTAAVSSTCVHTIP